MVKIYCSNLQCAHFLKPLIKNLPFYIGYAGMFDDKVKIDS